MNIKKQKVKSNIKENTCQVTKVLNLEKKYIKNEIEGNVSLTAIAKELNKAYQSEFFEVDTPIPGQIDENGKRIFKKMKPTIRLRHLQNFLGIKPIKRTA